MNQHVPRLGRARVVVGVASALALVSGCARDVAARYPGPPRVAAGAIDIALTQAAYHVTVTVDGNLLATDRHAQRVRIDNVPPGPHQVKIAMGGGGYTPTERVAGVVVQPYGRAAVIAAAPDVSTSTSIRVGLVYVGEMIGLGALLLAAR
jgi:hypothetical protein